MSVRHIQVLSEAEADLDDGMLFYESQEQGVGEYFWDSILSDIESLIIYAGVHSKVYDYYRMPSKRFPYSIYWSEFASKNYALSVQGFSIIILQRSHSDSLQFNWNDFQSFVKQPMDFQSIVVEYDLKGNTAYVIAVLPERRNPNWVRSKLGQKL